MGNKLQDGQTILQTIKTHLHLEKQISLIFIVLSYKFNPNQVL